MRSNGWAASFIVVGVALAAWGWFLFSFLTEPSAVGRVRIALIGSGVGSIVLGGLGAGAGLWMLFGRRN